MRPDTPTGITLRDVGHHRRAVAGTSADQKALAFAAVQKLDDIATEKQQRSAESAVIMQEDGSNKRTGAKSSASAIALFKVVSHLNTCPVEKNRNFWTYPIAHKGM
jgi:hypothetical protein